MRSRQKDGQTQWMNYNMKMRELWGRQEIRLWLAIVGAATIVLGAAYLMVQQEARLSANEGPTAAAESAKSQLQSGKTPAVIVGLDKTDVKHSYQTFIIITDDKNKVLASSAQLNGKTPIPPIGVIENARKYGFNTVTWQPENDVRLATYVTTYKSEKGSGVIIAGKSLKLTEDRIGKITLIAGVAWTIMTAWLTLIILSPLKKIKK
jgi:hypothetical protein